MTKWDISFETTVGYRIINPRPACKIPIEAFEKWADDLDMSVDKLIDMLNVIHEIEREVRE